MEAARRANEGDLRVLVDLWRMAVDDVGVLRGGATLVANLTRAEPLEPALRADLTAPDRLVVAGCIDEIVVGVAAAYRHRPPSKPAQAHGVVEMLFVETAARFVGVGGAMMDVVVAWAADRGCVGVDAPALPGARDAKAFFETTGLVARLLVMHRSLPTKGAR